jgi:glycosyltransferase involved in cell wall biosynthesis
VPIPSLNHYKKLNPGYLTNGKSLPEKICIITQSHLCRNPRVLKEAITLAAAGYEVCILTGIISADLYQQDLEAIKAFPNLSLQVVSDLSASTIYSFTDKLFHKLGRLFTRNFKTETILSLGYGTARYYNKAKAIKAQLYICHQELATCIGTKLLNADFKIAFDFEDWYSEDLLSDARAERPINLLRRVESVALNKGIFCVTTSNALAKKLSAVYACPTPEVIYNVFTSPGTPFKKEFSEPLKLFWFSQTIGPGRGLEQFIKLLSSIKSRLEIHLLGNIDNGYREKLDALLPKQHLLCFHDTVKAHKLAEKITEFDIGLALELDTPMSRNYTITNKFFQYIQSGLPVITSETEGQDEAFEMFKPGFKLPQQASDIQIAGLEKWLNDPVELQTAKNRAIEASAFYNWENESKKLLALVKDALEK